MRPGLRRRLPRCHGQGRPFARRRGAGLEEGLRGVARRPPPGPGRGGPRPLRRPLVRSRSVLGRRLRTGPGDRPPRRPRLRRARHRPLRAAPLLPRGPPPGGGPLTAARPFDPDDRLLRGTTLIEASAGTGKTFTITTLVLKLILEEQLSLGDILVVTFTEAATAELRERIRNRLGAARAALAGESLPGDPWLEDAMRRRRIAGHAAADARRLDAALASFDQATIATIHGFCRRTLNENAFESGLRFDTELLPDAGELVQETVADFWTERAGALSPALYRHLVARKADAPHLELSPGRIADLVRLAVAHPDARALPRR
ncbi:MAG: hypothetical protein D6731_15780, partial [Planctomycetota bacterium]